ncbi:MAG: hypothetical protein QE277_04365 [Flectobacillus sp.]|nr:hypothetical protein [Flectobacillus sp.]
MKTSKFFLPLIALFFFISTVSSFAQSTVSFSFIANFSSTNALLGEEEYTITFYGASGEIVESKAFNTYQGNEVFFDIPTGYYSKIEVYSPSTIGYLYPYSDLEIYIGGVSSNQGSDDQNIRIFNGDTMKVTNINIIEEMNPQLSIIAL